MDLYKSLMFHTSYILLDKIALNNNIEYIRNRINRDVRYSMVVKANAYGHGIEELLPLVEQCGVNHFSVFSVAEAKRVFSIKKAYCDLMIMGFIDADQLEEVVALLRKHAGYIQIEGICSHLAGAESIVNYKRITGQIQTFNELCNWFHAEGFQPRYKHLACSAGVLNYPDSVLDMVLAEHSATMGTCWLPILALVSL